MGTIGIIGGMGPAATADLFCKIIANTAAETDQQHLRVLIDSNTAIPDRTAAIAQGDKTPLYALLRSALALEHMGADLLLMACNTAHHFYPDMLPFLRVPFLNMPEETVLHLERQGLSRVGLLATDGMLQTGIYERALGRRGIEALRPDGQGQRAVMALIYEGVKAERLEGYDIAPLCGALDKLMAAGAQALLLACTELPLAFAHFALPYPGVDPTLVLARAAILRAGGRLRTGAGSADDN